MCALHTQNELSLPAARQTAPRTGHASRPQCALQTPCQLLAALNPFGWRWCPKHAGLRHKTLQLFVFVVWAWHEKDIASFIMRLMAINFAGRTRLAVGCRRMLSPAAQVARQSTPTPTPKSRQHMFLHTHTHTHTCMCV